MNETRWENEITNYEVRVSILKASKKWDVEYAKSAWTTLEKKSRNENFNRMRETEADEEDVDETEADKWRARKSRQA